MPVEILPEGIADWIEYDDEPDIMFMGEDPFCKTKTGGSDPNLAILYRGGPGFLDRSVTGGKTWSSILPGTNPPWFEVDDYYKYHADFNFFSSVNMCLPGRPSPAPGNGSVEYMGYSGSKATSGYHHVLVRHSVAEGAGSHLPTYTGWILSTINDWVTHDWFQIQFDIEDLNDQLIIGDEFHLTTWSNQSGQPDFTDWGAGESLIRYSDSLYGVHTRGGTAGPEAMWFEVDFNTTTKVFTTPNPTHANNVHTIFKSGDVISGYIDVHSDVLIPRAVYSGESFGGGLIQDRVSGGSPTFARIGVVRFTSGGGSISYDDTYISGRLDDPDTGASFVFAHFKYINKAGKMVFLYTINWDGVGDFRYYWVEFNASSQTFGALDTTWPGGGVDRDFEQVGPVNHSNVILVARVVSEDSTTVTFEVALLDLSTSSLVSSAQQIVMTKDHPSNDRHEVVPMIASNNSAEIEDEIGVIKYQFDHLSQSTDVRHGHIVVDYTLTPSFTVAPRQPTGPNPYNVGFGEAMYRRLRTHAFVSTYEDGYVWDISEDAVALRKLNDCADILDIVAHSGLIDGTTNYDDMHGASFGTGGKLVLMLGFSPLLRHFVYMRYMEHDFDGSRTPFTAGNWPESFMLTGTGDAILCEDFIGDGEFWTGSKYEGATAVTPLNVVAGIPDYEWLQFGTDPWRFWDSPVDPSDIIARNTMGKMLRDTEDDGKIYLHGNLDIIDSPSDPFTIARFNLTDWIAFQGISWELLLNSDDVPGWDLAFASALLFHDGTLYVIRDTGSACFLWQYDGGGDWSLVGGPIGLDSVNHNSMDVDNLSGDIVVAGRVADLIMVVSAPSPYTSWSNLTFSHRNDRGVTGLLVLD